MANIGLEAKGQPEIQKSTKEQTQSSNGAKERKVVDKEVKVQLMKHEAIKSLGMSKILNVFVLSGHEEAMKVEIEKVYHEKYRIHTYTDNQKIKRKPRQIRKKCEQRTVICGA